MAPAAAGFTLVELLVVMAIMAFASLAVAPALQNLLAPRSRPSEAEQLMAALALARDDAIRQRRSFRGVLFADERGLQDGEGRTIFQPSANLRMEPIPDKGLPCAFRPDGGGCALALLLSGAEHQWRLQIDALTGRARLLQIE